MLPGHFVGVLRLRAMATVMSHKLAYPWPPWKPHWDQGSMTRKSVEVKSCIPWCTLSGRGWRQALCRRREPIWALAGCSLCNNESCLAKGLPACTSLKEVCTTLCVPALGLAGCSMAAQDEWLPIPRSVEEESFRPLKFREEKVTASTLSWRKLMVPLTLGLLDLSMEARYPPRATLNLHIGGQLPFLLSPRAPSPLESYWLLLALLGPGGLVGIAFLLRGACGCSFTCWCRQGSASGWVFLDSRE